MSLDAITPRMRLPPFLKRVAHRCRAIGCSRGLQSVGLSSKPDVAAERRLSPNQYSAINQLQMIVRRRRLYTRHEASFSRRKKQDQIFRSIGAVGVFLRSIWKRYSNRSL